MRTLLALAATLLAGAPLGAQSSRPTSITTRLAVVRDATVCACDMAGTPAPRARNLAITAIGIEIPLARSRGGHFQLSYTPEALPLIVSERTADERLAVWRCGSRRYCGTSQTEDVWSVTSIGAGVLPIGFTARAGGDVVRLRARIGAGGIRMSRPIPLAQGRKFNFLAEGGAGLEVRLSRAVSVHAGGVVNHISNGGTASVNLGMDSKLIELGLTVRR